MALYALKPWFQNLLRPVARHAVQLGVTANQVTLCAATGSVAIGVLLFTKGDLRWLYLLAPLWSLARMALNAVDGMIAREFGQTSALGGYLNELGDVISDAALYAPFALVSPFNPFWVGVVILLAAVSEMAGVMGLCYGRARRYDGPIDKSDRALVFGVLGIATALTVDLPDWAFWVMPVLAALLVVTVGNRVRNGLRAASPVPDHTA